MIYVIGSLFVTVLVLACSCFLLKMQVDDMEKDIDRLWDDYRQLFALVQWLKAQNNIDDDTT